MSLTVDIPTDDPRNRRRVRSDSIEGRAYLRSLKPKVPLGCGKCHSGAVQYEKPIVRNLAYHIAPFSRNGVWQWNVAQLKQRLAMFNGRRTVAIVTGPGLDPIGFVKELLGKDVDYITAPNNPALREVVTFLPLLQRACATQPNECTFYGHAKGVTRGLGSTATKWAEMMYKGCLDYWPLVEQQLIKHPITGCFKKHGHRFEGSQSSWHYSGTFYWLRNCRVFQRAWTRVDQAWWGNESWPGLHFNVQEAGCLFHDHTEDLYDANYTENASQCYLKWAAEQKAAGHLGSTLTSATPPTSGIT